MVWVSVRTNNGADDAFAFVDTFPNDSPQAFVGQSFVGFQLDSAIAHEVAHVFGLRHQRGYNSFGEVTQEYRTDHEEGPILGGFSGTVHQFSIGHAGDPTTLQDDIGGITSKLIEQGSTDGFRIDDHGGSLTTPTSGATALTDSGGNVYSTTGITERSTDVDAYSFVWNGGVAKVDVAAKGVSSLNPVVHIYDANGTLVGFDEPDQRIDQRLSATMNLSSGTYYVLVSGWGDYGDIGQYTLDVSSGSGNPPAAASVSSDVNLALDASNVSHSQIGLTWTPTPGALNYLVERSEDGVNFTAVSAILSAGTTSYIDIGLAGGTSYVYRLRANVVGDLRYSSPLIAATHPAAVTDLAITSLTDQHTGTQLA